MADYDVSDLNAGNAVPAPKAPDIAIPESVEDFFDGNYMWIVYVVLGLLTIGAVYYLYRYLKKKGKLPKISLPFIGNKYAPKGRLSDEMKPTGGGFELDFGKNDFDNAIVTVGDKGELYIAGGDGEYRGTTYQTVILKLDRGKDPNDESAYEFVWGGSGKCYALTYHNGNLLGIKSDHGSMWEGAKNWRIWNFTTGKYSDHIDGWWYQGKGAGTGQYSFLNGNIKGDMYIYFLRAIKGKFYEFGGTVHAVSIDPDKLVEPDKLNKGDFSKEIAVSGLTSSRKSSSNGWPMAVTISVYCDGDGRYHATLGRFVTAAAEYFASDSPEGGFARTRVHYGDGVVPRDKWNPSFAKPGENFMAGVFGANPVYFNDGYKMFFSGSGPFDGMYWVPIQ